MTRPQPKIAVRGHIDDMRHPVPFPQQTPAGSDRRRLCSFRSGIDPSKLFLLTHRQSALLSGLQLERQEALQKGWLRPLGGAVPKASIQRSVSPARGIPTISWTS